MEVTAWLLMPVLMLLSGTMTASASEAKTLPSAASETPAARPCPGAVDAYASCYGGQDGNGAYYLVAIPKSANGTLVVHAHGGPRHVPPAPDGSDEDLVRFSVMVRAGYSWIGSTFRSGGYGVRQAAADVDNSRSIYWKHFGRPARTILHGQSYGGNVAAKLAELDALEADGRPKYDGVFLTSAALGKRIETYNTLINTRVIYQYFCRNLPLPGEPQYPAWQGLPKQSTLTREELGRRVNDCTGADRQPKDRTARQAANLLAILGATGEAEAQLSRRLELATFRFQDVIHNFLGGQNPFDNSATVYKGSGNDAALNKGVERFTGTAKARDLLAYDSDLSGNIVVPTIALQAKFDPVVNYRAQTHYQRIAEQAGQSHLLLQLLTSEDQHSKLSESEYLAALSALADWLDKGQRPTLNSIKQKCAGYALQSGQPCLFIDTKGK
jgi:alpha-beta hydrolase superfamily lysophospholipase